MYEYIRLITFVSGTYLEIKFNRRHRTSDHVSGTLYVEDSTTKSDQKTFDKVTR